MLKLIVLCAIFALALAGKDGYCQQGGTFTPELSGIYRVEDGTIFSTQNEDICIRMDDIFTSVQGREPAAFSCDYSVLGTRYADVRAYWEVNAASGNNSGTMTFFGMVYGGPADSNGDWIPSSAQQYILKYVIEFDRLPAPVPVAATSFDPALIRTWESTSATGELRGKNTAGDVITYIAFDEKQSPARGYAHAMGTGYGSTLEQTTVWGWLKKVGDTTNPTGVTRDSNLIMTSCVDECDLGDAFFPQVPGRYQFSAPNYGKFFTYDGASNSQITSEPASCDLDITYTAWPKVISDSLRDASDSASGTVNDGTQCINVQASGVQSINLNINDPLVFPSLYWSVDGIFTDGTNNYTPSGSDAGASGATPGPIVLSLLVDVSGSVSPSEYSLMMNGYGAAFESTTIKNLIIDSGICVHVGVQFFSSSDRYAEGLSGNFDIVCDAATADAFAAKIRAEPRPFGGLTDVSRNLAKSVNTTKTYITSNNLTPSRVVIDISGDGCHYSNTEGRTAAIAEGYNVNAIAVQPTSQLVSCFTNYIIAGPDKFVVDSANDFSAFAGAVETKLKIELSAAPIPSYIGQCIPTTAISDVSGNGQCAPSKVSPLTSLFDTTIDATLASGRLALKVTAPWEETIVHDSHNYALNTTVTFKPYVVEKYSTIPRPDRVCDYTPFKTSGDAPWDVKEPNFAENCRSTYQAEWDVADLVAEGCHTRVYCTEGNQPEASPSNTACDPDLCQSGTCYKIYEFEFSVDRFYNVEAHTLGVKAIRLAGDEHRIVLVTPWILTGEVTVDYVAPPDVQWAAVIPLLKYSLDPLFDAQGNLQASEGSWEFEVKTGLRAPFELTEVGVGKLVRQSTGAPLEVDYTIENTCAGQYNDSNPVTTLGEQVCTQRIRVFFDDCDMLTNRYSYQFSNLRYTCDQGARILWPEFCVLAQTQEAVLNVDIVGTQSCDDIRQEVVVGGVDLDSYLSDWSDVIKTYLFGTDSMNLRFEVLAKNPTQVACEGVPPIDDLVLTKFSAGQRLLNQGTPAPLTEYPTSVCQRVVVPEGDCDKDCVYCCVVDPTQVGIQIGPNDPATWWTMRESVEVQWSGFTKKRSVLEITTPAVQSTAASSDVRMQADSSLAQSGVSFVQPLFFLVVALIALFF